MNIGIVGGFPNSMCMSMISPDLKKQLKQYQMYQGYLAGKMMAQKKNEQNKKQENKNLNPENNKNSPQNNNDEISIKFQKGGKVVVTIKMKKTEYICDLLNEYFVKQNVQDGKFFFNGQELSPMNMDSLAETGLKDGDIITVN